MLCINRQGGTVLPSLCKVAVELWEDCITMMVHRRAVHVPRIQNVEADRLIQGGSIATRVGTESKIPPTPVSALGDT